LLFCGFLLINNSYDNNCQCQVQLDMDKWTDASSQYSAIYLLEYQILQTKEFMNIDIKNLETGMDLLSQTKYTIKYKANL
jgi:hypothetical protein